MRRWRWCEIKGAALAIGLAAGLVAAGPLDAAPPKTPAKSAAAKPAAPKYVPPKYAAIVIDADSGAVLHAVAADEQAYPASLTKMMTLYLTFAALADHRLQLEHRLVVSERAAAMAPSKLGLKPGSSIRVEDAVLGIVTRSANDAAVVLAEAVGGSEENFALMMTQQARALGMARSYFENASGLPDTNQVTTARDMLAAVEAALPADAAVFAAAVADWRTAEETKQKIKKGSGSPKLDLVENPDILATVAARKSKRPKLVVGFAAETDNVVAYAKDKRARKGSDWIVANDVSAETGIMGGDHNKVHLVTANGVESWPDQSKDEVARALVARIAAALEQGAR